MVNQTPGFRYVILSRTVRVALDNGRVRRGMLKKLRGSQSMTSIRLDLASSVLSETPWLHIGSAHSSNMLSLVVYALSHASQSTSGMPLVSTMPQTIKGRADMWSDKRNVLYVVGVMLSQHSHPPGISFVSAMLCDALYASRQR
jgi:hypothetical protein